MAALYQLPLVVILLRIQASLANETTDSATYPRLIIEPDLKGQEKILKVGEDFSFTCTFEASEGDRHTKAQTLNWTDEYRSVITKHPGANAQSKSLSGKSRRVQLLILKPDTDLLGKKTYWCTASYNDNVLKKNVTVNVFGIPSWRDPKQEVTGRLDESLEVDCDATPTESTAHVDVVIVFQNNTDLPKTRYNQSNNKLYIKPLTMDERNATFRCTAIETHPEQDVVLESFKTVSVNLQFPPVFEKDQLTRYGIIGRSVTLPCRVIDANPRVTEFEFYAGDSRLRDGDKYHIDTNTDQQTAILTINNLEESDFQVVKGYHCRVVSDDNQFEREMQFTLKAALPPAIPEVTFKRAWRSKIEFEIKEVKFDVDVDNPPVNSFEVRFLNFNDIKASDDAERRKKLASTLPRVFNKTDSNLYIVDHLHWRTLYTFDIRAVNEAGASDPVVYNATTLDENAPEAMTSGATMICSRWCAVSSIVAALGFCRSVWSIAVLRH